MRKLLHGLGYVAGIYALGILVFTVFRLILFVVYSAGGGVLDGVTAGQVAHAFAIGFRFDTVVSCYILALPLFAVLVCSFARCGGRAVLRAVAVWGTVLYSVAFLLSAANIPYFLQFGKPINSSIWNWMGEPSFVIGMIVGELSFIVYLLLLAVVLAVFVLAVRRWYKVMGHKIASIELKNPTGGVKHTVYQWFVLLLRLHSSALPASVAAWPSRHR